MRSIPCVCLMLLVPTIALAQGGGGEEAGPKNPLASLNKVAKALDKSAALFLGGKTPAEAFKPWKVESREIDELRKKLKDVGAAKLSSFGFEFELNFQTGDKGGYYLRTYVVTAGGKPRFMGFDGRQVTEFSRKGLPLDKCTGQFAAFSEAAKALIEAIKAKQKLPFADAKVIGKMFRSKKLVGQLTKMIEGSRKALDKTCAPVRAHTGKVHLVLDDQMFLVTDAKGTSIGGVRGDFRVDAANEGKLKYNFGRFRAFPKDKPADEGKKDGEQPKKVEKEKGEK